MGAFLGSRLVRGRVLVASLTLVLPLLVMAGPGAAAQVILPPPSIPNNFRFAVTPTVADAGSLVTVTSIDPCPIPAGSSVATATVDEFPEVASGGPAVGLMPAPGSVAGALVAPFPAPTSLLVHPDGSWSGVVRLDGVTGRRSISASCSAGLNGQVYASYLQVDVTVRSQGRGYWFGWADGEVTAQGDANAAGERIALNAPLVGIAAEPGTGAGYWTVASDGGVFAFGEASYVGSAEPLKLNAPIVGIAATPDGGGYWLAAKDGGVFAYGDARFFGSALNHVPSSQVVGIAATSDGGGYWLAEANGTVVALGDAPVFPAPGQPSAPVFPAPPHLNAPVVGIAPTRDGGGYWLAAADGGVFAFGDAGFDGSMAGRPLAAPVTTIAADASGAGYWLGGADGGVFSFGDADFYGSGAVTFLCGGCPPALLMTPPLPRAQPRLVGLAATPG